ncbi:hypothetical protein K438DRAFT_1748410 [Mycena galopus ATCC 62051]|nr:hypothetical protein K438DRAFT_1748410 [Mycena galopus ATCC 62051]
MLDAEFRPSGKNSTLLQVPFLNLMANIAARAGSVMIRVGGNSQESTQLAPDGTIPDSRVVIKNLTGVTGTTQTPRIFQRPPVHDAQYLFVGEHRLIITAADVEWHDRAGCDYELPRRPHRRNASDVSAFISISGGFTVPASVQVKYLAASSMTQKGNYKWAGQMRFASPWMKPSGHSSSLTDARWGRRSSRLSTATQQPRPAISVPAPGFALVFLNSDAAAGDTAGTSSMTFPTTALTKTKNTVTVNPSVLATSNGMMLSEYDLAGTSEAPSAAPRTDNLNLIRWINNTPLTNLFLSDVWFSSFFLRLFCRFGIVKLFKEPPDEYSVHSVTEFFIRKGLSVDP